MQYIWKMDDIESSNKKLMVDNDEFFKFDNINNISTENPYSKNSRMSSYQVW